LGPTKAKALLAHFGSVRVMSTASVAQLCEVPGVGPALASAIRAAIGKDVPEALQDPRSTPGQVDDPQREEDV
jgi:DNA repair protein RadC